MFSYRFDHLSVCMYTTSTTNLRNASPSRPTFSIIVSDHIPYILTSHFIFTSLFLSQLQHIASIYHTSLLFSLSQGYTRIWGIHQTFALVNQSRSHQPLYFLLYFLNQVAIPLFEIVLFFFYLLKSWVVLHLKCVCLGSLLIADTTFMITLLRI